MTEVKTTKIRMSTCNLDALFAGCINRVDLKARNVESPGIKIMNNIDKKTLLLNSVFNSYNRLFSQGFHNVLWQILMNDCVKNQKVSFTGCYDEHGLSLVIAHASGGFIPSTCLFKNDITYNKACDYAEDISVLIFNITKDEAANRVNLSFRNNKLLTEYGYGYCSKGKVIVNPHKQ